MKNRETTTAYGAGQQAKNNTTFYASAKAFAILLIAVGTINGATAQTTRTRISAIDMVTGQNDQYSAATSSKTAYPTTNTTTKVTHGAVVNTPTNYIHGEDKYLKNKEVDHRYGEFEVYDINGKNKEQVMLGLLTNTLDRDKRYDDKGAVATKMTVATTTIDKLDANGNVVKGEKVNVSAIRFNDKIFVIIGENDFRYLDGKKIIGDTKLTDALAKGKPITELTFFYELQHAGYVKNMSAKQFSELTLAQKERLLNNSNVAGL